MPPRREIYYDTVDKKLLSNRWLKVIDGNYDCVVFMSVVEYDREIISYDRMVCVLRNKIGEYLYSYDKKTYRMMKDDSI